MLMVLWSEELLNGPLTKNNLDPDINWQADDTRHCLSAKGFKRVSYEQRDERLY